MYRRDTFVRQGGPWTSAPGEDLEYSLPGCGRLGHVHPFFVARTPGRKQPGPDKRQIKPFCGPGPRARLGDRDALRNPFHDVWRAELLPSV